jgi:hypothetical protein
MNPAAVARETLLRRQSTVGGTFIGGGDGPDGALEMDVDDLAGQVEVGGVGVELVCSEACLCAWFCLSSVFLDDKTTEIPFKVACFYFCTSGFGLTREEKFTDLNSPPFSSSYFGPFV